MKIILFAPEKFFKCPLRKVGVVFYISNRNYFGNESFQGNVLIGYGSELTSTDAGSDGYPRGYSNAH